MTHEQFFKSVKSGDVRPAYLFCGAEQHVKNSALQALKNQLLPDGLEQFNESSFEGSISASEVIDASETLPLACDRRLVIVKDWGLLLSGKVKGESDDAAQFLAWLDRIPDSCCVVLYLTDMPDAKKQLTRELKKKVEWVQFDLLSDADILRWANRQLKSSGKQLTPDAAERLVFMAGRSLTSLSQELQKLDAFTGENPLIGAEHVEAIVTPSTECTVFQMIDCVLRRQSAQAHLLLKNMLENGESRLGALAMLTRQLRMLTHIRLMRAQGMTLSEIERRLSLNHYAAARAANQAGQFTVQALQDGYRACVDTDYAVKSGRMRDDVALDYLMLKLLSMK